MQKTKVDEIYERAKESLRFSSKGEQIYRNTGKYWKKISEREATQHIYGLFPEAVQAYLSDAGVREAIARLRNTPTLQIKFTERAVERYVNVSNGVFDVEAGRLLLEVEREKLGLKFDYIADFSYQKGDIKRASVFQKFLQDIFPEECEAKTELLMEIMGYCLSGYTQAKAGFFFIGESNSGKSTLLSLVKRVLPEGSVTAIPLQRLANRFNLARLDGTRINICSEISEDSFKAVDVFKMLTSGEMVTAEHKGKQPFEFYLCCKSLNAGNVLPKLGGIEGMDAILNRLIILLFPRSIKREEQKLDLCEKLWGERNVIFSLALDALVKLRKNNFIFNEPKDTAKLKRQMQSQSHIFQEFLEDTCVQEKGAKEHIASLYSAFAKYCEDNLCDTGISKNQFVQRLCRMQGLERKKLRIQGSRPLWGVEGIRLKKGMEYDIEQDSETSDRDSGTIGGGQAFYALPQK